MIHIAEHQDEASKDFPLEEGAASATPQESDYPALSAATMCSARQHRSSSGLAPAEEELLQREGEEVFFTPQGEEGEIL
jgi:hypothetical protein